MSGVYEHPLKKESLCQPIDTKSFWVSIASLEEPIAASTAEFISAEERSEWSIKRSSNARNAGPSGYSLMKKNLENG
jgi:hypothetical protein